MNEYTRIEVSKLIKASGYKMPSRTSFCILNNKDLLDLAKTLGVVDYSATITSSKAKWSCPHTSDRVGTRTWSFKVILEKWFLRSFRDKIHPSYNEFSTSRRTFSFRHPIYRNLRFAPFSLYAHHSTSCKRSDCEYNLSSHRWHQRTSQSSFLD